MFFGARLHLSGTWTGLRYEINRIRALDRKVGMIKWSWMSCEKRFSQVVVIRQRRFKEGLTKDQLDMVATFSAVCEARRATDRGVLNAFTLDSWTFCFLNQCSLQFWSYFTFIFKLSLRSQGVTSMKTWQNNFGFITFFDPHLPESGHSKKNGLLIVDVLLCGDFLAVIPFVGVNTVHKFPFKPRPIIAGVRSLEEKR